MTTDLSNYQMVDGLIVPVHDEAVGERHAVAEITIAKWEVNIPVDDELFKMPEEVAEGSVRLRGPTRRLNRGRARGARLRENGRTARSPTSTIVPGVAK